MATTDTVTLHVARGERDLGEFRMGLREADWVAELSRDMRAEPMLLQRPVKKGSARCAEDTVAVPCTVMWALVSLLEGWTCEMYVEKFADAMLDAGLDGWVTCGNYRAVVHKGEWAAYAFSEGDWMVPVNGEYSTIPNILAPSELVSAVRLQRLIMQEHDVEFEHQAREAP